MSDKLEPLTSAQAIEIKNYLKEKYGIEPPEFSLIEPVSPPDPYATPEFRARLLQHFQTARNKALATHTAPPQ